jgi:ubiquinone/menaquinone biosynthesis C-methylase UbiE
MDKDSRSAFFAAHATGWEDRNYPPEMRDRLPAMIRAFRLQLGTRVLDVGCGTGALFPYLREAVGMDGQLIALDASAEMLRWAAAKGPERAVVLKAPAEAVPLIDDYLDTIVCFSAFPHFSDKAQVAREFHRILRPGGSALVAHLSTRDEVNAHHDRYAAVAGDHMPCPVGMKTMFTAAGFVRTHLDERPGWYLFRAEKEKRP